MSSTANVNPQVGEGSSISPYLLIGLPALLYVFAPLLLKTAGVVAWGWDTILILLGLFALGVVATAITNGFSISGSPALDKILPILPLWMIAFSVMSIVLPIPITLGVVVYAYALLLPTALTGMMIREW